MFYVSSLDLGEDEPHPPILRIIYFSDGFFWNQAPTRKQLEKDWYKIQLYDNWGVARAYIPNTTWTMEWRSAQKGPNLSNKKYEEYIMTANPDRCRNNSDDEIPSRHFGQNFFCKVFIGSIAVSDSLNRW